MSRFTFCAMLHTRNCWTFGHFELTHGLFSNSEEHVYYSVVHRPTTKAGCNCTQQKYVFRVA